MMTLPTHFSLVDPRGQGRALLSIQNFIFMQFFPVGQGNRLEPLPLGLVPPSLHGKSWIDHCSKNVLVAQITSWDHFLAPR